MRVKVDMESDALYFRLCEDDIEDSEEIAQGIIIDYNKDATVVGIEILGIKARLPVEELSRMTIELPNCHTASPSSRALICSCVIAPLATHRRI